MAGWMAFVALALAPQDATENPEFKYWASFKVGSWVKLKQISETPTGKTEMEITQKLAELGESRVVLEVLTTEIRDGKRTELPMEKKEIPARLEKEKKDPGARQPKDGTEELELNGKKLMCRWLETSYEEEGTRFFIKTWTCRDVPGGIVRKETSSSGRVNETIHLQAVDWSVE